MDEGLQFTNYKSSDMYDKHIDRCYNAKVRKLSLSIQLTDPNNYEGGELYIYENKKGTLYEKATRRFNNVSVIYVTRSKTCHIW